MNKSRLSFVFELFKHGFNGGGQPRVGGDGLFVQVNDFLEQLLDFVVFVADLVLKMLEHDVGKHPRDHQSGGLLE